MVFVVYSRYEIFVQIYWNQFLGSEEITKLMWTIGFENNANDLGFEILNDDVIVESV